MSAPYSPQQIAAWFLRKGVPEGAEPITHLKLQKLVYYAQAWSLAILNKPLFDEDFKAWRYGPVEPSLYHELKKFGYSVIPSDHFGTSQKLNEDELSVIKQVREVYGKFTAEEIRDITHHDFPWIAVSKGLPVYGTKDGTIPKRLIQDYYKQYLKTGVNPSREFFNWYNKKINSHGTRKVYPSTLGLEILGDDVRKAFS